MGGWIWTFTLGNPEGEIRNQAAEVSAGRAHRNYCSTLSFPFTPLKSIQKIRTGTLSSTCNSINLDGFAPSPYQIQK